MDVDNIRIRGARVHNLKSVDLDLPLRRLICFAGPSGSGKTSLAFHTLHSESKRRFINSFPNSMKFFADRPAPVDVDEIYPVLPVFGLPQINPVLGSRSVVADVMRLTEVLQGLWYHYSRECCPNHRISVERIPFSAQLGEASAKIKGEVIHLLIGHELGAALFGEGFAPPRTWDSARKTMAPFTETDDHWEVLRFKATSLAGIDEKQREVIPLLERRPLLLWAEGMKKPVAFSYVSAKRCPRCDYAGTPGVRAGAFAPHTALGACKACNGYGANLRYDPRKVMDPDLSLDEGGVSFLRFGPLDHWSKELGKLFKRKRWSTSEPLRTLPKEFRRILDEGDGAWPGLLDAQAYLDTKRYKPAVRVFQRKMQTEVLCAACQGSRLDGLVDNFLLGLGEQQVALKELSTLTVSAFAELAALPLGSREPHALGLQAELVRQARLAAAMGLGHLSLGRKARSLSAGEYQRLLLLKYLSFKGTDALFVLDEPSLGLGPAEQAMLIAGLREVIAQGNTVVVVDHSRQMQQASDHLIVMGPEAGHRGGEVLYSGATSGYAFAPLEKVSAATKLARTPAKSHLEVSGAVAHGRAWSDFSLPLGKLVWAHGPSGAGKSARLVNVLAQHLHKALHRENLVDAPGKARSVKGARHVADVVVVDANLNRFTSRSSVGTLTELAPAVRRHFLKLPVARAMGLKDGHLSRNSELGMCPRCQGAGHLVIEMQYLEDIILPCEDCKGVGMKPLYANLSDGHMTVAQAFQRPLGEVLARVELTPKFRRTWEYLKLLNLDYLSLDRPLNSLSGGERQRVFLLSRLLGKLEDALIIFENLSFGLSPREIARLGEFLQQLAQAGHTIVVIDNDPQWGPIAQAEMAFSPDAVILKET